MTKVSNPAIKKLIALILEKSLDKFTLSGTKKAAPENNIIAWAIFENALDKSFHCSLVNLNLMLCKSTFNMTRYNIIGKN